MTGSISARRALRRGFAVSVSVLALGAAGQAMAQTAPPCQPTDDGYCVITNTGASGTIVVTSPAILINSGTISGTTGVTGSIAAPPPNDPRLQVLVIQNRAGGTITGTGGTAVSSPGVLINAGTISGNVTGVGQYIADGGTLTGNLQLGTPSPNDFSSNVFVQRGSDAGVSGTISAGQGIDTYARSYSSSATVQLGGVLPTTFEVEGFEARGSATVTVTGTGQQNGYVLLGNGNVVNQANIGTIPTSGSGLPAGSVFTPAISYMGVPETNGSIVYRMQTGPNTFVNYSLPVGGGLTSFTNQGIVNGDIRMTTASFTNAGTLNLQTHATGTLILAAADRDFLFSNSGAIRYADTGGRVGLALTERDILGDSTGNSAIRIATVLNDGTGTARAENSGNITGGIAAYLTAHTVSFLNTGQISGMNTANAQNYGVVLSTGEPLANDDPVLVDTVTFVNADNGVINDGAFVDGVADNLVFENSGTIVGHPVDNRAISIDQEGLEDENGDDLDVASLRFTNGGTVTGDVVINTGALDNVLTNSGSVTVADTGFDPYGAGSEAVEVEVETVASHTIQFNNSGSIVENRHAGTALSFETESEGDSTITFTNSGTIRSDAGATRVASQYTMRGDGLDQINPSGAVVFSAGDVEGTASITIENQAGGLISATGALSTATPNATTSTGSSAFSVAIYADADIVNLTNAGTIQGTGTAVLPANTGFEQGDGGPEMPEGRLGGAIHLVNSTDHVINTATGTITGGVELNTGNDVFENYGTITGDVHLGQGDDTFIFGTLTGVLNGSVYGGAGTDTLSFDITGTDGIVNDALLAHFFEFEVRTLIGTGTVVVDHEVEISDGGSLELSEGTVIDTPGQTAVSGGDDSETLSNNGTINGNVDLGEGDNEFGNQGQLTGNIVVGDGDNTIDNQGTITGDVAAGDGDNALSNGGTINGNITTGDGDNQIDNSGTVNGNVTTGDGSDSFANSGEVNGDVDLAGGDDHYSSAGGTVSGTVDAGDGIDSYDIALGQPTPTPASRSPQRSLAVEVPPTPLTPETLGNIVNFEMVTVTGPGTVLASGDLPVGTVVLNSADLEVAANTSFGTTGPTAITGSTGSETVTNRGTIRGGIALGDGADQLLGYGLVTGAIDLGGGNDTLTIGSTAAFQGPVSGGAGSDTLLLPTVGTAATPYEFTGTGFTGFETLSNSAGVTAYSGNLAVGTVSVTGGRLIGRTGSVLTGSVTVGSGATFGSAGTVNGNVNVLTGGTLSPGASPGIMTVNGNVGLATGTTTLFEFVAPPGQSDQLVINGSLTIASGATISLTGTRPLTPGTIYNLITTTGGITGTFTTVNQAATVLGFLRYTPTQLQLLGTFLAPSGVSSQTGAAIDYVNGVLVSGSATPALMAAVPSLLSSTGTADAQSFGMLTPEAYASAAQLSIENGLSLAKAGRAGLATTKREEAGPFAFAQGFGNWRRLKGSAYGISSAESDSYGGLGGVGFGGANGSVGAFIGKIDGRQRIAALGARTDANGVVAGIAGHFRSGGLSVNALAAYDWSKADTVRAVPGGTARSRYDLHALVLDGSIGYEVALSESWAVRPAAGVTHISADRGAASESGSAAFQLAVAKQTTNATFLDGSLVLEGGTDAKATVHPWLQAGVRHQLAGERVTATGGFVGGPGTLTAIGALREETVATVGAGVSVDLSTRFSLYGAYQGEFGGGKSHNVNVGIRFNF